MTWAVDQASLATPVNEQAYGDTSITLTTNVVVASDAWVFVFLTWLFSDTLTTVAGGSLSWSITQGVAGSQRVAIARAFAPSGLASSSAITATWTGGDIDHKWIGGASFTGGDADSFDAAATINSADASTAFVTNAISTAEDDELLVAVGQGFNGSAIGPTAPAVQLIDSANGTSIFGLYRIAGAAGSYQAAGTLTFADDWASIASSMKVAAGAPAEKQTYYVARRRASSR